jgi:protein SCO1/2/putative membrane protein
MLFRSSPLGIILSIALAAVVHLVLPTSRAAADSQDPLPTPVPRFSLTERSGRTVTNADLLGKVWIASFVFTRCSGPCPAVTATMARLQSELADRPDLVLVSFTVDPDHDDPHELTRYASRFGADPARWLFLTGKESEIYELLRAGFKVAVQQNQGAARQPGNEVMHSTRLAVVDRHGRLRAYADGLPNLEFDPSGEEFESNLRRLRTKVARLLDEDSHAFGFPELNASLNGLAALLLTCGYVAIRRRLTRLHAACMLTAVAVSALFLGCYLYYHLVIMKGQPTYFSEKAVGAPDWARTVYYCILGSHTLLAVPTAPLVLATAWLGLRGRLKRHVPLARWTLPLWFYVSVTGVVVYWMLYRLYV